MVRRLIAVAVAFGVISGCVTQAPSPGPSSLGPGPSSRSPGSSSPSPSPGSSESAPRPAAASPSPAGGVPDDVFTTPPIVFDLAITRDDSLRVVKSIGPDGGRLSTKAADGTSYTLEIPPDAILFAEDIAMTPIIDAAGLPGDAQTAHVAGVKLEPDGLELFAPATLRITSPSPVPEARVATFGFEGDGKDAGLVLVDQAASEIRVRVDHFSGYASFWPLEVGWWQHYLQMRQAAIAQDFRDGIGRAIALEQQKQLLGIGNSSLDDVLKGLAAGFDRWVLEPLLRSAPLGCTEATAAVSAYLEWNRQMQMLGVSLKDALPEEVARATKAERERDLEMRREPPPELLPTAFELCSEEKFRRCQITGDFEGLRSFFLGFIHTTLMFGQEVSRDVITRAHSFLERCGRWDLTLESVEDFELARGLGRASTHQTRTYEIRWKPGAEGDHFGLLAPIGTGEGTTDILAASSRNSQCRKITYKYEGTDPADSATITRLTFRSREYVTADWVMVPDRGDGTGVLVKVQRHVEDDPRPVTVGLAFPFGDQTWRYVSAVGCVKFTTDLVSTVPGGFPLSLVLAAELRKRAEDCLRAEGVDCRWRFGSSPFSATTTITKTFPFTDYAGVKAQVDVEAIVTLVHTPSD